MIGVTGGAGRIEEADGARYQHDDDGNLVEKADTLGETTRYRWSGAGMLEAVELPDGRELHYRYDVLARRLSKQVFETREAAWPAKEVRWRWDGHTPLTELDSEEGKTTWVFDPETFNPLAKLAEGKVWGVLTDQIGTPTELIAQDGTVAWQGDIDTYGHVTQTARGTDCPFRWPCQMEDEETPLREIYGDDYREHVSGVQRNGPAKNPTGSPPGSKPPTPIDFTGGAMKSVYKKAQDGTWKTHTMYPEPADG